MQSQLDEDFCLMDNYDISFSLWLTATNQKQTVSWEGTAQCFWDGILISVKGIVDSSCDMCGTAIKLD